MLYKIFALVECVKQTKTMRTNSKLLQAILLGLFFKVAATEIFPLEEMGDFIIGKEAISLSSVLEIPPAILEEGIPDLEDVVLKSGWNNLFSEGMLQLIMFLLIF